MGRHNRPRPEDRYDTDVIFLPFRPRIRRITVHPLKTIFYNADAEPGAAKDRQAHTFDDELMRLIQRQL